MPTVHITELDDEAVTLDVPAGTTVMRAAVDNCVQGIIGECGGAAMCGTCHVLIDPGWLGSLPPMLQNEDDMLDCTAAPREANSRLACQLRLTDALDGLRLRVPERQR